jgi:hypothetical protein
MEFVVHCYENASDCFFSEFKDTVLDSSNIFSLVLDFKPSRTLTVLLVGDKVIESPPLKCTFLKKINASNGYVSLDSTEIHFTEYRLGGIEHHVDVIDAIVCLYDTHYTFDLFDDIKYLLYQPVSKYFIGSRKNLDKNIFYNRTKDMCNIVSFAVSLKTKDGLEELLQKIIA